MGEEDAVGEVEHGPDGAKDPPKLPVTFTGGSRGRTLQGMTTQPPDAPQALRGTLPDGAIARAVREGAALFAARELGTILVRGKDRQSWLNGLLTCDLNKVTPQIAAYGLILVKIGRIVADAYVVDAGDRLLVGVRRERLPLVREHLEKYLMMEDATHADASDDFAWAFAHGPRGASVFSEVARASGGYAGELDLTGAGGAVLVAPSAALDPALAKAVGAADPVVMLGTEDDWNAVRVAHLLPRFGLDFSEKNYPQEASLERIAVSFTKGCYLGQEVVCRLEMRGHVIKKIVGLELPPGALPSPG
jgi:folate-binding protein YgfZ